MKILYAWLLVLIGFCALSAGNDWTAWAIANVGAAFMFVRDKHK